MHCEILRGVKEELSYEIIFVGDLGRDFLGDNLVENSSFGVHF